MGVSIETKGEVPLVQNEVTKKIGYSLVINAEVLIYIVFIAHVFFHVEVSNIALLLLATKLTTGTLLLGYLKRLKVTK